MRKIFVTLYSLAWHAALPLLQRLPRLRRGWNQRTLQEIAAGPFDLWIQAASGGESLLTTMILAQLSSVLPGHRKWRILATSGTSEGIDSLIKGCKNLPINTTIEMSIAYFPFDTPQLMAKAFAHYQPKMAVIVETELWPAFLLTAKKNKVPVMLVNGRMSEKSFRSYKYCTTFFRKFGPEQVLAISPTDQRRFSKLIGPENVSLIDNIKFDKIGVQGGKIAHNPIADLLAQGTHFILLGSFRRQEERRLLDAVAKLRTLRPDITIGLFPKHTERANHVLSMLRKRNISAIQRSKINGRQSLGSVIVWDVFGELAGAYALADAAFVGGSLVKKGGQNFLEPLAHGLKPIIGPYWQDFAWVGREIVAAGLVIEVADENQLVEKILTTLDTPPNKQQVMRQIETFFRPRIGGTLAVCRLIVARLGELEQQRPAPLSASRTPEAR